MRKDLASLLTMQEMCDKVGKDDPSCLQYVPDWFVTQRQIDVWYDDTYYCNDYKMIKWNNGYKKPKTQNASIKEELLPIAWHLSRW